MAKQKVLQENAPSKNVPNSNIGRESMQLSPLRETSPNELTEGSPSPDRNNENYIEEVLQIIKMMAETELSEIELETASLKLSLKKVSGVTQAESLNKIQSVSELTTKSLDATRAKTPLIPALPKVIPEETFHKILSPMAGTFYLAPSPNSPPYVKEGDKIAVGQPVCIVEAMKLMNEIKADKVGKVVKIMVENAKSVEKGTVLFFIDLKG